MREWACRHDNPAARLWHLPVHVCWWDWLAALRTLAAVLFGGNRSGRQIVDGVGCPCSHFTNTGSSPAAPHWKQGHIGIGAVLRGKVVYKALCADSSNVHSKAAHPPVAACGTGTYSSIQVACVFLCV
jgi:hypothetical protein